MIREELEPGWVIETPETEEEWADLRRCKEERRALDAEAPLAVWRTRLRVGRGSRGEPLGEPRGWIYFIRCTVTGHIKIGLSNNPWTRLEKLQTGCPTVLELAGCIPSWAPRADERHFHWLYQSDRLRRRAEWFEASENLTDYINRYAKEPRRWASWLPKHPGILFAD